MIAAAAEGYVAISTDGGHTSDDPADWGLPESGMPDHNTMYNFVIASLGDAATIGKSLAESAYGSKPKYSYWTGCSQGDRVWRLPSNTPKHMTGLLLLLLQSIGLSFRWEDTGLRLS